MNILLLSIILNLSVPSLQETIDFNPYEVLNVDRRASTSDIRSSYKKLAKEWHPDKNKSPNAQDKFIEIQQAYEILSDETKREQFDTGGYSGEPVGQWQHNGEPFHFQYSDFTFDFQSQSSIRTMSLHDYYSRVIPESHNVPHLIYVYSTFCGQCIIYLRTSWQRAASDLEALGVVVYAVDTTFTSRIASNLGVTRVPTIVGFYKERSHHFKGAIRKDELKYFVSSLLPRNLITMVSSDNFAEFLGGIDRDDKPRVILFSEKQKPALLYSLMSLKYQLYYSFGYVCLKDVKSQSVVQEFSVNKNGPTLLVFKNSDRKPSVILKSSEMPQGAINDLLSVNKFVAAPRLTSQRVFDELCSAPQGAVHDVRLCLVLISDPSFENHEAVTSNLKLLVEEVGSKEENLNDWLTFMRVHTSTQPAFTRSLILDEISQPKLVLLWRRGHKSCSLKEMDVDFLKTSLVSAKEGFQICLRTALEAAHLQRFQRSVTLSPLVDELAPGTILKILRTILDGVEYSYSLINYLASPQTMAFIILSVLLLLWINTDEDTVNNDTAQNRGTKQAKKTAPDSKSEKLNSDKPSDTSVQSGPNRTTQEKADEDDSMKPNTIDSITSQNAVTELTPNAYESLVLNQIRGHMTIILLCDPEDGQLIEGYSNVCDVFRRDRKVSFTYLDVKKFSSWYNEIRLISSAEPPGENEDQEDMSSLHSNGDFDRPEGHGDRSRNTISDINGIVLAINGLRHWYCIFVPRGVKWGCSVGNAEEESYVSALSCWMDRVREGQMPRLYVRQWPGLYARKQCPQDDDVEF